MTQEYDVFICHRGETKRNFVSVLGGMLRYKGITCFVDYRMAMGKDVQFEINGAIECSKVFIVVLSPDFARSRWCLEEISEIMKIRDLTGTPNPPRKVIPVFYDVERDMVRQQEKGTSYDLSRVKRSDAAKIESWGKALKDVCELDGFVFDSDTTLQWEKSVEIVSEVEGFLISHRTIPDQGMKMPIPRECINYDVFICHWHLDTQRNVVSVLRGMLLCKSITPFVVAYGKDEGESALDSDIAQAIENSRMHVIFLSPNFAGSRRCLEEVVYIMNIQGSPGTSDASRKPTVLPIFYDTEPSTVRHQIAGTPYCLDEVQESSTDEERNRWARALQDLSLLHGLEYKPGSTFQWEKLYDVVKIVEASAKKITPWNNGSICEALYLKKINEVFKELELQEKCENVFLVGVYGRRKSEFSNLLVEILGSNFHRVCKLNNIMEKAYQVDGILNIVRQMLADLIQPSTLNYVRCQLLLENGRYLVVLDDLGNDIDKIKTLLEELKSILRNRSLVVVGSHFQHTLQELNVHKFINLLSLENRRDALSICYTTRDRINDAFLSHLSETFDMLGLDVRLLNQDKLMGDSTCLRDAKVILCIISKSFSIGEFKSMFTNGDSPPKIIYVSYGSNPTVESMPKPFFEMEVDFEKAEFNRPQFKSMVNEVVQTLNERGEEIMGAIDFPVGLAQRSSVIECSILDCVSRNKNSVQCFGLVGMGGVGKTTLARSIFNKIHSDFERSFFSLNTRAELQAKGTLGLVDVQKKIMAKLLNKIDDVKIDNEEHGRMVLKSNLRHINALVVLDDVDDVGHLEALCAPLQSSLGPKSVIIITTRDRNILDLAKPRTIFDIEGLDKEMSKRLFYWHAFMKPKPPADLEKVSQSVIEACQGLPLSLKIIGSHLYGKFDTEYWQESFKLLQKGKKGIFHVLRISFDGLDSDEKEAFLDICCFLIDEDVEFTCMFLNACYGMGKTHLNTLKNKCLITTSVDEDDGRRSRIGGRRSRIGMHDHLRDMGRHIIREERRDRAWDEETANEILQDAKGRSSLRGLSVWSHIPFPEEAFDCRSLPQLRILMVKHDPRETTHSNTERGRLCPQDIFRNVRCGGLRWLKWERAPFEKLPHGLCCRNIRVLELSSSEISEVPTASLPNLQHLDMSGCRELKRLDPGIGRLTSLRYLNLARCIGLTSLPKEMMSLSSLQVLVLNGCQSLATLSSLPTSLRTLSLKMENIEFEFGERKSEYGSRSLATLSSLPTTLRSSSLNLYVLDLEIGSLKSVEEASLPNLRDLTITRCAKLKRLALHATSLERLDLSECGRLEYLDLKDGTFHFPLI